jgi:hypothetical protein
LLLNHRAKRVWIVPVIREAQLRDRPPKHDAGISGIGYFSTSNFSLQERVIPLERLPTAMMVQNSRIPVSSLIRVRSMAYRYPKDMTGTKTPILAFAANA